MATLRLVAPYVNAGPLNAGCVVDGHWGQYGASRVLRECDSLLGTELFSEAAAEMNADADSPNADDGCMTDELPGCEIVSWCADEAEALLNAATIGGYWSWHDGEFYLTETDECTGCGEWIEADGDGGWLDSDEQYYCPAGGSHAAADQ